MRADECNEKRQSTMQGKKRMPYETNFILSRKQKKKKFFSITISIQMLVCEMDEGKREKLNTMRLNSVFMQIHVYALHHDHHDG